MLSGDPKLEASQVLPDFPYAGFAELIGLRGIKVQRPEEVGPAWDQALASDRPVVLEAVTDPEVPPLPPTVRLEQARNLAAALLDGDPSRNRIVAQSVKEKVQEFLHR